MHGARLGIDIGGVLTRIGDVRNLERCGFRPAAEDRVAKRTGSLGDTNMHIISNKMIFDELGICVGFEDPLIHVFNKNEASLSSKSYHDAIAQRRNVILMGDSLGDLRMSEGLAHNIELTIGFLSHDIENLLPSYLEAFDIVLTNDTDMSVVLDFLALFSSEN